MATGKHYTPGDDASRQTSPMNGAAGVRPVRTAAAKNAHGVAGSKRRPAGAGNMGNSPRRPRWHKPIRPLVVGALVGVLALVGVGGVLAWLVSTDSLTNTFGVGEIKTSIDEDFNNGDTIKENVAVKNEGNIDAWIRAQVNIYWVDKDGNQLWDAPVEDADYSFDKGGLANWLTGTDGYYYYTVPVAGGDTTTYLIDSLTTIKDYGDGRKLVCDIAAQAIQADPYKAVEDAWSVEVVTDGTDGPKLELKDGKVVTSTESEVA